MVRVASRPRPCHGVAPPLPSDARPRPASAVTPTRCTAEPGRGAPSPRSTSGGPTGQELAPAERRQPRHGRRLHGPESPVAVGPLPARSHRHLPLIEGRCSGTARCTTNCSRARRAQVTGFRHREAVPTTGTHQNSAYEKSFVGRPWRHRSRALGERHRRRIQRSRLPVTLAWTATIACFVGHLAVSGKDMSYNG